MTPCGFQNPENTNCSGIAAIQAILSSGILLEHLKSLSQMQLNPPTIEIRHELLAAKISEFIRNPAKLLNALGFQFRISVVQDVFQQFLDEMITSGLLDGALFKGCFTEKSVCDCGVQEEAKSWSLIQTSRGAKDTFHSLFQVLQTLLKPKSSQCHQCQSFKMSRTFMSQAPSVLEVRIHRRYVFPSEDRVEYDFRPFQFSARIRIPIDTASVLYELRALIVWRPGTNKTQSHFLTYVHKNGKLYRCDDERIQDVTELLPFTEGEVDIESYHENDFVNELLRGGIIALYDRIL